MALATGTRVGPYEVIAQIGAGGMGEVYRARDTKLNRDVALKILPDAFTLDGDRIARFRREAQVLASLNHANIAAIYGFEDSGSTHALVLELVEGPTLADRIAKGPIPFDEALPIAKQIAEALDAAHEQGIIHRDLKPANIKLRDDGTVKVLDFGLAKALEPASAISPALAAAPTITSPAMTLAGAVLGTAAYMAPEQARGQAVDRRADIWAFGVVLYEMLTGTRPFDGGTVSDTLAAVLRAEPTTEPLPAHLRSIVDRCLRKDPRRRWRDIGDVTVALEEPLSDPRPSAVAARRSVLPWIAISVLSLVAAGALFVAWRAMRPEASQFMRLNVSLGSRAVAGGRLTVAVSPDGSRIAFPMLGTDQIQQLATQLLAESQPVLLPGTENAADPFFSPDGRWIGFFANGKMKKVSVQGGAVVTLCDAPNGRGGSWGDDGNIIVTLDSISGVGLSRVPSSGGTPQSLTKATLTQDASHRWPQILPDGQAVIFTSSKALGDYENSDVNVLSMKTGQLKKLLNGGYFSRYLPSGHLVFLHGGTLFGVAFDVDRLQVRGTPVPLLQDVAGNAISAGGQFDFSRNGTFVYLSGTGVTQNLAWLDSAGQMESLRTPPGAYFDLRLSPDGKRLALSEAAANLVTWDWRREQMQRLTFIQGSRFPVWTPDGRHLAYSSEATSLRWIRADGGGDVRTLLTSKYQLAPYSFSPDGKHLAYTETTPDTEYDVWTLPLDIADPEHPKPGQPELFLRTPFSEQEPAFSPDGHWLAYTSNESGVYSVYVRPFPARNGDASSKWQISTAGGRYASWSPKGHELFYEDPDNRILVVSYTATGDSFTADKPRAWSPIQLLDVPPAWNYTMSPDGKRFAIIRRPDLTAEQKSGLHVTMLLNFFDEVRRRIPVK